MANWRRTTATIAMVLGVVVGPESCSDHLELDPPTRAYYEGEYPDEVGQCVEASIDFINDGPIGVNFIGTDFDIAEEADGALLITGKTRYVHAEGDEPTVTWTCSVVPDAADSAEITGYVLSID